MLRYDWSKQLPSLYRQIKTQHLFLLPLQLCCLLFGAGLYEEFGYILLAILSLPPCRAVGCQSSPVNFNHIKNQFSSSQDKQIGVTKVFTCKLCFQSCGSWDSFHCSSWVEALAIRTRSIFHDCFRCYPMAET